MRVYTVYIVCHVSTAALYIYIISNDLIRSLGFPSFTTHVYFTAHVYALNMLQPAQFSVIHTSVLNLYAKRITAWSLGGAFKQV